MVKTKPREIEHNDEEHATARPWSLDTASKVKAGDNGVLILGHPPEVDYRMVSEPNWRLAVRCVNAQDECSGDEAQETNPSPAAAREDDAGDAIRTEAQCEICAKPLCGDGRQIEVVTTTLVGKIVNAEIFGVVCKACSLGSDFEVLANGSPIGRGPTYAERQDAMSTIAVTHHADGRRTAAAGDDGEAVDVSDLIQIGILRPDQDREDAADEIRENVERMKVQVGSPDLVGPAEFLSLMDSVTDDRMSEDFDREIREALDPVQLIDDAAKDLDRWEARLTIPEVAARILDQGHFAPVSAALWANRGGFGTITALARAASGVFARRALEKRLRGESPSETALHGEGYQEPPQRRSTDDISAPPTAADILRRALVESDTRYISSCSDPTEAARIEVRGANFVRSVLNRLLAEVESPAEDW